ncbi:hypothetical protein C8Q75DRAFT_545185 [Abortiporus biennis]|nr:hypothetical protein C8Q75DRAFT_545185 [Abortiporus biennis]
MTFEENEEPGSRALRYILTLVAWHKATRAVIQVADLAIKVQKLPEICLVRLADYSSDAVDDVKTNSQGIVDSLNAQIADEYANDEEAGRSISQWIEEQCIMPNTIWPYRVHAEAGLMALLKMVQEGSVDFGDEPYKSTIKFFEEVRECTIGASKKCCYMCHLLGEYMFNESSENLTPTIHLPGTHGHVFPWDPPSFGIPDTILDKLAQKLRQDIIRLAVNNASTITNRSGQSSPTSDSGDRRRVSFTYTWD